MRFFILGLTLPQVNHLLTNATVDEAEAGLRAFLTTQGDQPLLIGELNVVPGLEQAGKLVQLLSPVGDRVLKLEGWSDEFPYEKQKFKSRVYTSYTNDLAAREPHRVDEISRGRETARQLLLQSEHIKLRYEADQVALVKFRPSRSSSTNPEEKPGPNASRVVVNEEEDFGVTPSFSDRSDRSLVASDLICVVQMAKPSAPELPSSGPYISVLTDPMVVLFFFMVAGSVVSLVIIAFLQWAFSILETIFKNLKNRLK